MRPNILALRLNSVLIIYTYKLITDKLDLKAIANEFISIMTKESQHLAGFEDS